jgi:hypothetical protein
LEYGKDFEPSEIKKIFSSNNIVNEYSDYQSDMASILIYKWIQTNLKAFDVIKKQNVKDITKLEEDLTCFILC